MARYILLISLLFSITACVTGPIMEAKEESVSTDYLIGPGDSLSVFVWRNPEVSTSVTVRPDGKISTPLVEDLPVSGKKPSDVARLIEQELSKFIREPIVTIIVGGFQSIPEQKIRVIGNASEPKSVPYSEGMTLLDVMIEVNGLTEFAAGDRASLIRKVGGKQEQYRILLDTLIKDGDISQNRNVLPGDIIIIPESIL